MMPARRADLLIGAGLAALTLVVTLYWAPRGFHFGFTDMGNDDYLLRQALDLSTGGVIFRDTFDVYGPFNGYLNTVGFLLLGHRLLAIKWWLCGWYGGIAALLYGTARRWLSPLLAAFSVLIWIGLAPFYQHGIMISPHVYVLAVQALALWIALRSEPVLHWRWAGVGVLIGFSWTFKQVMGTLFFLAVAAYLIALAMTWRVRWRAAAGAVLALTLGTGAVVGAALLFIWIAGALPDWYRQTIAFPRDFYVAGASGSGLRSSLALFVQMQRTASPYWWIMRGVVVSVGFIALVRRTVSRDALLLAAVTGALSVATMSSANFMHQWWTVSLSIAFFIDIIRRLLVHVTPRRRVQEALTVVTVAVLVVGGLSERLRAIKINGAALSVSIDAPASFRGVRTTPAAKRMFAVFDDALRGYARDHPGTRVISIDDDMGAASLPFLSFPPHNPHTSPIYWNEPGLSTSTYPAYQPALREEIARTHPLIVDHQPPPFRQKHLPGYALQLVALVGTKDAGYWYLYSPVERDSTPHPVFLDWDGHLEPLPPDEAAQTAMIEQPNPSDTHGGARDQVRIQGADLYTFPASLALDRVSDANAVAPLSAMPTTRATAVTAVDAGTWTVDGHVDTRYGYLLQFPAVRREKGEVFVARGTIRAGGLSLGFIQADGQWNGVVNVTKSGPFENALRVPATGLYSLTVASCVESPWQSTLGVVADRFLENHFTVTQAGWLQAPHLSEPGPQDVH